MAEGPTSPPCHLGEGDPGLVRVRDAVCQHVREQALQLGAPLVTNGHQRLVVPLAWSRRTEGMQYSRVNNFIV
jgi:hypothetical protein